MNKFSKNEFFANHLLFPSFLLLVFWSASGFPILNGDKLGGVISTFLIIYVPCKTVKILVHQKTGIFRDSSVVNNIVLLIFFMLWLVMSFYGLKSFSGYQALLTPFISAGLVGALWMALIGGWDD